MRVHRIADFERLHLRNETAFELVGNLLRDDEPFRGNARLAVVDDSRFDRGLDGLIQIRTGHDDEWIAAAKLEYDFLHLLRGGYAHLNSGAFTAGERGCRDTWIEQHPFHLLRAY